MVPMSHISQMGYRLQGFLRTRRSVPALCVALPLFINICLNLLWALNVLSCVNFIKMECLCSTGGFANAACHKTMKVVFPKDINQL